MAQESSPSSVRTVPVPSAPIAATWPAHLIGRTDKIGNKLALRLEIDIARAAFLNDHAGVHDRDHVRHRESFDLVVGDVKRGDAQSPLQFPQLEAHALAQFRVEIAQRLVQKQDLRFAHQGTRQSQALLLPTGKLRRHALFVPVEFHLLERGGDFLFD